MASWLFACLLTLVTVVVLPVPGVRAEVFTALVHMEGLVSLEKELLGGLESYLELERQRLVRMEQFAGRVRLALTSASQDPSTHLSDPVNAYQLVNRFINGWNTLYDDIYEDNGQGLMANISYYNFRFPDTEDFTGAVTAILRLQDTYRLSPSLITSGKLGTTTTLPMTSEDSYEMGRIAYGAEDYQHTRDWMKETLRLFDEEGDSSTVDLSGVYDHLSFAEYKLGNLKRAAHYTRLLLQNDPTHTRAQGNIAYFERLIRSEPEKYVNEVDERGEEEGEVSPDARESMSEKERYESLCREPWPLPKEYDSELTCFYYDNHRTPSLVIRPMKVEVVFPQTSYIHTAWDIDRARDETTEGVGWTNTKYANHIAIGMAQHKSNHSRMQV
ncbi:Prolyl 4-hydroxylase subunit alpha-2 [Geodia barretti]|uniref:Prolyl 4-hydroxylase subunit alpha-2 n=1 Tax=Geodia barretti TaxID=519541 RepID=A0AA35WFH6_GEOBA|nr:Prolyl 4-hydroxylase subunit alpha-2 [Geodia barretti]